MPGMDGLELSAKILEYCDLPIVLLTSVGDDSTIIHAIEHLAEDYVTKPFSPGELTARVKRLLRRVGDFSYTLEPVTLIDDHLSVDFGLQRAIVSGTTVQLTPTETKLLHILIRAASRTVPTDFLLRRIWPHDEVFEDALRTAWANLG